MPSEMVGVPNICGIGAACLTDGFFGRVGQHLQARVAGRDRRVAVGDPDQYIERLGARATPSMLRERRFSFFSGEAP
jgi:hypothetical protein